ncbi:MAG: carboxypeptidase regulatory-like domain-containing protein [Candidatus Eisenbacteria bacterium]|jgi:carboxypeptidase D|nr:carboxypeptidase regulatory-like domain-containing protein [Candidatus Eisenbacteria bacterium]
MLRCAALDDPCEVCKMIVPVLLLLLLGAAPAAAREMLVEVRVPTREDVAAAARMGLSLDDVKSGVARGIIHERRLSDLRGRFDVAIIAADVRDLLPSLKEPDRGEYHSYAELTTDLQLLASTHPSICRLHNLGSSVQGRTIWGLEITDNADTDELEPEVRLIGAHHGNETISVEVPLGIAHYLLENYGGIPQVTALVDEREIWIIPMMNPDGVENGTRDNAAGVDLNRNYGYMREDGSLPGSYSQPETRAIRSNALLHNFGLSLSYHSGAEYINYLWNYTPVVTPDNAYIVALSQAYDSFVGYGITEGYDWYQTKGDCNDWSYGTYGGMDWTIEVSADYEPPQSQIDGIVNANRAAVIDFIQRAIQGIGGVVTDATSGDPLPAMVNIVSIDWPVFAQLPLGDYHRPLPAGTYTVQISHPGYQTVTISGVTVTAGQRAVVNATLEASSDARISGRRVVSANSTDYNGNYPYPTHGHDALGPPDGQWFSLGKNGWIVLDAGAAFVDGPGDDIVVNEAGSDGNEGYTLYVGPAFNGPWTSLGSGSGTDSFDLAAGSLTDARYLYVRDDDIGSATTANPGFDLDALGIGQPPDEPHLVLVSVTVSDPSPGDGDGRLDPGETADLFVTLRNLWAGEASEVSGTLASSDPDLSVSGAPSTFPDIPGGDTAANAAGFQVVVSSDAPLGHSASFDLALTAQGGYSWTIPFTLQVGQRDMLFVDADDENTEGRIVTALDAWGGVYHRWNTYESGLGVIPIDTLRAYRMVLWAAGDQNTSSVTDQNRVNLAAYLDQGGRLLLTAENYLSTYSGDPFTADYLHIASSSTGISGTALAGTPDDPVGDDVAVTLSYPSGLSESPDRANPAGDAAAMFSMQSTGYPVAIRYPIATTRSYRTMFFGAALEAFPTSGAAPNNIQTVVARCIEWLVGGDVIAPTTPANVVLLADGMLTWSPATDNVGVDHYAIYREASASFDIDGLTPFVTTTSTTASVPEGIGDPSVNYYFRITATDAVGNESAPSATVGAFDYGLQ